MGDTIIGIKGRVGFHGAGETLFVPGLLHQFPGLFEVEAGLQVRHVAVETLGRLLMGRRGRALHQFSHDARIVDVFCLFL